jgi:predicted ATPase/class 3 adenylate cyclase
MALRAPVPTGTVTLLFTDIEGSTQRWEERPDEMSPALRRHDELLRNAIQRHGGRVFKTMGDQFCAAFSRASDAIAAAADAQRALTSADWGAVGGLTARMALHSGESEERDGDYFGPVVNRVARLLAAVHGGQVVVSSVTARYSGAAMPADTELRDLGEHRLKDLIEPERVWQLVAPGLPDTFPPLRSLGSLPNNLPRQVTPLIGRDDVLAAIEALVIEHPLVTLTGTGGIGKTRLALQAGADLLDGSSDGVWFVELAPLSAGSSVAHAVASTIGLREQPNRTMLDVLVQYLRSRRLLLILDNCEHVISEAAHVIDAILRAAPQVQVIATSREPLRIAAENVYRVPSLAVPPYNALTAEEALQYDSIALFAERATASDAAFKLTDEAAPIVAEICRRLDGIALAIELAAARVKVMAPRELARKLDERFRVLTGGSRTALPRQQTMRALIDWSYGLLSQQEQRLFRRLAIFAGGWRLSAAEIVCADETLDARDVPDLLTSLVEKSLVVADVGQDSTRYRFLESTRAFALERLEESGEREAQARRHAVWAADLGTRAAEHARATQQYHAESAPEIENVRTAIEWAFAHEEVILATRILCGFTNRYRMLVGEAEVRTHLETALARLNSDEQPALASRAWEGLSYVTEGRRSIEAAQRAVELARQSDDPALLASNLSYLGFRLARAGRTHEAEPAIEEALELSRENRLTRTPLQVLALTNRALVADVCGRSDEARESYAEALNLATELGDDHGAATIRVNIAELEFQVGNAARALALIAEIEERRHGPGADRLVVSALQNGAAYRLALGDVAGARIAAFDALRHARGVFALNVAVSMQHLAAVAIRNGDVRRGGRLLGYVDAWFLNQNYVRESTEQRAYELLLAALREKLSDSEIEALAAEGARLTEDQAVAEALRV